ncbi:MAG: GAF domain-containing sensor histidine kinase [Gammaproteobacteria bacterium]
MSSLEEDLAAIARIDAVPTMLQVVCRTTGLGFAAVARVTEDRWVACAVRDEIAFGLQPGGELKVATTLCDQIRSTGEAIVIDHVASDAQYAGHPTPKMYGFQSYISIPIVRRNGEFFGTICALDPKPATVRTPEIIAMFRLFADLIAFYLDAEDRLEHSDKALLDARRSAVLREQFIAVLGHDLRSPLSAIAATASVLEKTAPDPETLDMAALIQRSTDRMAVLISDVMDFARGRLGGGLSVIPLPDVDLTPTLEQVIAELRAAAPGRNIEQQIHLDRPVRCDSGRIAQLLSNLIGNAVTHGDRSGSIRVAAVTDEASFELSVTNEGSPIPPDVRARLFEPFYRASVSPGQQGLGLGLYIASEIARAHAGKLEVESTGRRTCFTFRMPLTGAATPS